VSRRFVLAGRPNAHGDRWAWEVGRLFEGIDAGSSEEDLLRIAPGFPVFRVTTARS
jgi:hypothetical protein